MISYVYHRQFGGYLSALGRLCFPFLPYTVLPIATGVFIVSVLVGTVYVSTSTLVG